jgi:hypothetical protein
MATVEITYKKHVDSPNETFRDVKLHLAPGWLVMKSYKNPLDLLPDKEWGVNANDVLAYQVTE